MAGCGRLGNGQNALSEEVSEEEQMVRFSGVGLVGMMIVLVGCDDTTTVCNDVERPCETLGESRCLADYRGVEACREGTDGCLQWEESEQCAENMTCRDDADTASCGCTDSCEDGESRCEGDLVQVCEEDDDRCQVWVDDVDCSETDESCHFIDEEALCGGCVDDCDREGDTRCSDSTIERCGFSEDGCLFWFEDVDCAESLLICDDSLGDAVCRGDCEDPCEEGESACEGDVVQTCELDADGCYDWVDVIDCSAEEPPQSCDDSGGAAECVIGCFDDCLIIGESRCADDVIEFCEIGADSCLDWISVTDCAETGALCDDSSGTAGCVECLDLCDAEGVTQCAGDVIERCEIGVDECLDWVAWTDCADTGESCDDSSGLAVCDSTCVDTCPTVGTARCSGTIIESCAVGIGGCLGWVGVTDCAETGEVCDDRTGPVRCVEAIEGDSCVSPFVVSSFPFSLTGPDFEGDFTDIHDFTDFDCVENPGAVEAVFLVSVSAGTGVLVSEHGGLDADIMLQSLCGGIEPCVDYVNIDEHLGVRYTATVDGEIAVIVEADDFATSFDYDIRIQSFELETCADGVDNDIDGFADCDDDECFGVAPCTTEINCSDGADNDADRLTDCDDEDCEGLVECDPARGVVEVFESGTMDAIDLEGQHIVFMPDHGLFEGYSWTISGGVTDWEVEPGTGTTSTTLSLGDDSSVEYSLTTMGSFWFYGTDYDMMYVGSNGYVTFGEPHVLYFLSRSDFFSQPIVAAYYRDLDPASSSLPGSVTVDEFDDRVVVSYDDVPRLGVSAPNDIQIILNTDGSIELVYVALDPHSGMVGIGSGVGIEPFPAETNFFAPLPETCDDGVDNDGDGTFDCEDENCFGVAPCDTEIECNDDIDNDGDRTMDCDDPDCAAEVYCVPESDCNDEVDNDLDGDMDCVDADCDGIGGCEFFEVTCEDAFDNDGDGAVDCYDSSCFGVPPCTSEMICGDGEDNDADFLSDCDDPDCATAIDCLPSMGVYERWESTVPLDLEGSSIVFTPDATDSNGYSWSVSGGVTDFAVTPGSGVVTTALSSLLSDDAAEEYILSTMGGFNFYGSDYFSFFVSSNGYLTFGERHTDYDPSLEEFFSHPIVAPFYTDLHPERETVVGGAAEITVDEFVSRVVVTFANISRYRFTTDAALEPNDFQVVLGNDGTIELYFVTVAPPATARNTMVGVGSGGTGVAYPSESDFVP